MVLEEATIPSGEEDSIVPPSDADTYGTDISTSDPSFLQGRHIVAEVNLSLLPKPVPLVGPLFGYTRTRLVRSIVAAQRATTSLAGRPLVKDEADAVTYGIARAFSISSWGVVMGGVIGLAQCYRTAPDFKFPMVKPSSLKVNFNKFGTWRDIKANRGWHVVRGSLYFTACSLLGHFVGSAYVASTESKRFAEDPKLKNLVEAMISTARKRKAAANTGVENQASGSPFGSKADGANNHREDLYNPTYVANEQSQIPSHDASMGSYDDASPTGGSPLSGTEQTNGRSSWDRVREKAISNNAGSPDGAPSRSSSQAFGGSKYDRRQHEYKDTQAGGDSYTFSSTERDRQLDKVQAKKEFEAMLDRERKGENP